MTRQELAAKLQLTEPAITGILNRLTGYGLVHKRNRETGLRYKAAEFSLVGSGAYGLGVERQQNGGTITLCSLAGETVLFESCSSDSDFVPMLQKVIKGQAGFPAPIGVGVVATEGSDKGFFELLKPVPCFPLTKIEAALAGERLFGVGEPEGGLVALLIDEQIQAGMIISGRFYRGTHGRAGAIGSMRPGIGAGSLDMMASTTAYHAFVVEYGEKAVDRWIDTAASRLMDGVVTIAGFISPAAVLMGGLLPGDVMERLLQRMAAARLGKETHFVPAAWVPPVQALTFSNAVSYGAAVAPFIEILLPKQH